MVITFYKHVTEPWIEMYIDGSKVYAGHSMRPEWVALYISKALRNNPTGVNTLTVIDKEFDNDMMYTPVIGGDKDQYLGESYMEDW